MNPKYFKLKTWTDFLSYTFSIKYKKSYSQNGEDILIASASQRLGISRPTYLDIGANHPIYKNNTYLFYSQGSRGILIEPDPQIYKVIQKRRTEDIVLNVGIGPQGNASAPYYVMTSRQLSTFKQEEAQNVAASKNYGNQKIERVISIPLIAINALFEEYLPKGVDILSIDTEGLDFQILKSLNFSKYRPKILCIETLRFNEKGREEKQEDIIEYVSQQGYSIYADTYVNTIFIAKGLLG